MKLGACPCGCDDCDVSTTGDYAAKLVRDWLARETAKPATEVTPALAALFERCAEDVEADF